VLQHDLFPAGEGACRLVSGNVSNRSGGMARVGGPGIVICSSITPGRRLATRPATDSFGTSMFFFELYLSYR
jgi:hypothetical protein